MMDNKKKEKNRLFNVIAPIYGLFYDFQKRHYSSILEKVHQALDLSSFQSIIDIGCGTGALCSVFNQRGYTVTGVDPARKMLSIARNKQENKGIRFLQASGLERLPFDDKSFDISIASYVAHGLKADERKTLYAEMSRISKHLVIIYDYNQKRSMMTNIIEGLERGDYFNFIKKAQGEMQEVFHKVRIIDVGLRAAWYVCEPLTIEKPSVE